MTSFGIGCFHFGLKKKTAEQISASEYIGLVKSSLETIKSISSVTIRDKPSDGQEKHEIPNPIPRLQEGEGCFPNLETFDLSFDIYIPFRVQAEILEISESILRTRTGTERFRFNLQNCYSNPVGFVECLGAARESSPSDAVVLMRRFLQKELEPTEICFECLGPSPFHADFFLLPKQVQGTNSRQQRSPFECEQVHQQGYDEVVFSYDKRAYQVDDEAKEDLFHELCNEIDLFYQIKSLESQNRNQWTDIEGKIVKLLELQQAPGLKGRWSRLTKRGKIIDEIVCALCEFNSTKLFQDSSINEDYGSSYKADIHFLKHYIDQEIKNRQTFPTKEIAELTKYLEGRHSKSWEMIVVLIAAILGGIIGGLVTLYAQSLTPNNNSAAANKASTNMVSSAKDKTTLVTPVVFKTNSFKLP